MVKRFLSLLMLAGALTTAQAQYQFPNSSFDEDFVTAYQNGTYTEPRGWHGYATIDASSMNNAGRAGDKLVQSTDVRAGASGKCVYVKSTSILGVIANGVMTNGQIYTHSTTATDGSQNYNFSNPSNTKSGWGENNKFFTEFTGRPDYMKVWLKNMGAGNARVSVFTHKAGTVMYDPTNNVSDNTIIVASGAVSVPSEKVWKQYTIPFTYNTSSNPGLILATFTTNETPGQGKGGDKLYIDDIEMVYISEMQNAVYNGVAIAFDGSGNANIDGPYNPKMLKYTTGVGAEVVTTEPTEDNNYTLTVAIKGNDYSVNPSNAHTYRIKFTGLASGNDDEASVNVVVPTLASKALNDGRFYLMNVAANAFLNDNNNVVSTAVPYWTISTTAGTVMDEHGHYLVIDRDGEGSKDFADHTKLPVTSTSKDDPKDKKFTFKESKSPTYVEMYRSNLKYYVATAFWNDQKGDIYAGAENGTLRSYKGSLSTNTQWMLISPADYIAYYFCKNAAGKSMSNSLSYSLAAFDNEANTTLVGMPLGVYSIDDGEKFYLANGTDLKVTNSNSTLTYYGRLDFSLNATYDGQSLSGVTSVDKVYEASKLNVVLSGNGQQTKGIVFDEDTYQLTITIEGYGRSKEYTIQFAQPDLSLNATWYGEKVKDGDFVNEAYKEAKLVVTPAAGVSVDRTYNASTGRATITLSYMKQSQEYHVDFALLPATVGTAATYAIERMYQNGASTTPSANHKFTIAQLENGNINFSTYVSGFGTLTATDIRVAKNGDFSFNGNLRPSVANYENMLTPVTIYGKLKDGVLQYATVDAVRVNATSRYLQHQTYGIAVGTSQEYTKDIVVTINGDATVIANQTVSLQNLTNGNVSFTLKNFQMEINGATSYIGDIFLENLPIDKDGNFTFEGGMLIGPGSDTSKQWGGLDLGIVPLSLRGQRYDNGNEIIVVIDIDMQESLGQTIHVTMGADAQTETTYTDDMHITVNGDETVVPNTNVKVGHLKNGNINFTLTDFTMTVNGQPSYIGNIAIDNIALDANGNFTYAGVIRIGKGTDPEKEWGGPELGNVPVVIRGSVTDFAGGNSTDGQSQCAIALDVDMQASLSQTIHVTYGLQSVRTRNYTDILAVTVNGVKSTQETEITVETLRNNNISFTLDNFILDDGTIQQPIGSIAIENLIVDAQGKFSYEGTIRIGKGSDSSKDWGGPDLGDVPVIVDGQFFGSDLLLNIDIDMEASLNQTINVTFGATPVSSKTFTDDIKVIVNGEESNDRATITVGTLKNGYVNFVLNNFTMNLAGQPTYIGNIAINALEIDAEGKFSYNGNVRIAAGTEPNNVEWGGPDLGAIPLELKGQKYTYEGQEYLLVSIAIDMQESIGQTIDVLFGGTPVRTINLRDKLSVTINGDENNQQADVTVGMLRNGDINFTLRNFVLEVQGETNIKMPVGNLSINALSIDQNGRFSYTGNLRIGNGDDPDYATWEGPGLGDIPVVLNGKLVEGTPSKAYVAIDIDMREMALEQMINVVFGTNFAVDIVDIVNTIANAKAGTATKADVDAGANSVLRK